MADKKIIMSLDDIMGDRFGRYSKYIIQDRALPDVRDGLKPVQRRILYSMFKEGNVYSKPYRKSAKTVGNVIGNYHPHGDTSVYDAMVRMSQEWKIRVPLIDMQGNNGSIDNDPPAAMRYTEARLSAIAEELLQDIDKDTVLMSLNFDDTEYEPTVLPAAYPNLLVNGATGISAGYATDIPPHNLSEVIDATIYRIKHPRCNIEHIMKYMKGPDFPTGAIVEGKEGILQAFTHGKAKVVVRAKTEIQEERNLNRIVVHEIPYEVNKSDLVRKIDEIRVKKDVDGIIEVRDESDRQGLRIAIEIKKDISVTNVLNYLYKNTDLQKNYNYNMVAIKDKRPVLMGVIEILDGYINHQKEVILRRSQYDLKKANDRLHIVDGLIKAISILDEVVKTIRSSKNKADAKNNLQAKYQFTERQAEAIVMLQLYRLTNTDIVSLTEEKKELDDLIAYLKQIISSEEVLLKVIIERLTDVKKKYPMTRLTQIEDEVTQVTIDEKSMILSEDTNISITRDGYIKRISDRSLKASENIPFGKKENDVLVDLHHANTLDNLLLFTNKGNYLYIPVYKVEDFKWKDAGKHVSYLVKTDSSEKIIGSVLVKDFDLPLYVLLASKNGQIKRTLLKDFEVQRYSKPIKCMNLKQQDEVIGVALTNGNQAVSLTTRNGYGSLYSEEEVSIIGVKAAGIKAMKLKDDQVISLQIFDPLKNYSYVLVSEDGKVKRLKMSDISLNKRTAMGTSLYKKAKRNPTYLKCAYVCNMNDQIKMIYSNGEEVELTVKDYHNATLEQCLSALSKAITGTIEATYLDRPISTDSYPELKKPVKQKIIPQVKEEVKLDVVKEKKQSPVNKDSKKAVVKEKQSKEVRYEKISLEDILNDLDF